MVRCEFWSYGLVGPKFSAKFGPRTNFGYIGQNCSDRPITISVGLGRSRMLMIEARSNNKR